MDSPKVRKAKIAGLRTDLEGIRERIEELRDTAPNNYARSGFSEAAGTIESVIIELDQAEASE